MIESKDDTPKIESKFMERTKPLEKQQHLKKQLKYLPVNTKDLCLILRKSTLVKS